MRIHRSDLRLTLDLVLSPRRGPAGARAVVGRSYRRYAVYGNIAYAIGGVRPTLSTGSAYARIIINVELYSGQRAVWPGCSVFQFLRPVLPRVSFPPVLYYQGSYWQCLFQLLCAHSRSILLSTPTRNHGASLAAPCRRTPFLSSLCLSSSPACSAANMHARWCRRTAIVVSAAPSSLRRIPSPGTSSWARSEPFRSQCPWGLSSP